MELTPTPSQTAGPFLHIGMTDTRAVSCIAGPQVTGERVSLKVRLFDGDGLPVSDGMIEIWQANAEGKYQHPEETADEGAGQPFRGFGRMSTGEDGSCRFETIRPGRVFGPDGISQAPHLSVGIFGRGLLKRLSTRIYFAGDAANDNDPVLRLVPQNLRHTVMAEPDAERKNGWKIDIHLCGEAETVFFDI